MTNSPYKTSPILAKIFDDENESLTICWDYDYDPDNIDEWTVNLNHYIKPDDHNHITLSQEHAKKLHKWLTKFLTKTQIK